MDNWRRIEVISITHFSHSKSLCFWWGFTNWRRQHRPQCSAVTCLCRWQTPRLPPPLPRLISPCIPPDCFCLVKHECAYERSSARREEAIVNPTSTKCGQSRGGLTDPSLPATWHAVVWNLGFMWMIKVFGKVPWKGSKLLLAVLLMWHFRRWFQTY